MERGRREFLPLKRIGRCRSMRLLLWDSLSRQGSPLLSAGCESPQGERSWIWKAASFQVSMGQASWLVDFFITTILGPPGSWPVPSSAVCPAPRPPDMQPYIQRGKYPSQRRPGLTFGRTLGVDDFKFHGRGAIPFVLAQAVDHIDLGPKN